MVSLTAKTFAETFQVTGSVVMKQEAEDDTTASETSASRRSKHHPSSTDTPGLGDMNQRVLATRNSLKILDLSLLAHLAHIAH